MAYWRCMEIMRPIVGSVPIPGRSRFVAGAISAHTFVIFLPKWHELTSLNRHILKKIVGKQILTPPLPSRPRLICIARRLPNIVLAPEGRPTRIARWLPNAAVAPEDRLTRIARWHLNTVGAPEGRLTPHRLVVWWLSNTVGVPESRLTRIACGGFPTRLERLKVG